MTEPNTPESYIVNEGKKRGSTREVRPEALHDRFYTVLRVHPGDAILTNNWHTTEVFDHARNNFEGYTFAMRTLEAWGAMIENDRRAPGVLYVVGLGPKSSSGEPGWRRQLPPPTKRGSTCALPVPVQLVEPTSDHVTFVHATLTRSPPEFP